MKVVIPPASALAIPDVALVNAPEKPPVEPLVAETVAVPLE